MGRVVSRAGVDGCVRGSYQVVAVTAVDDDSRFRTVDPPERYVSNAKNTFDRVVTLAAGESGFPMIRDQDGRSRRRPQG